MASTRPNGSIRPRAIMPTGDASAATEPAVIIRRRRKAPSTNATASTAATAITRVRLVVRLRTYAIDIMEVEWIEAKHNPKTYLRKKQRLVSLGYGSLRAMRPARMSGCVMAILAAGGLGKPVG